MILFNAKAFLTGKNYIKVRNQRSQYILETYHPIILHADKVKQNRPLVFIANHNDAKDQELIMAVTEKIIHWWAKKEYFQASASYGENDSLKKRLVMAYIVRYLGCIRIDRSDTIPILARKYNVPIKEIMQLNNLIEDALNPGQILTIPSGEKIIKHKVYKGDNKKAFKETDRYLAYGHSVGGFPEGTRGEGEELGKFGEGLIISAMKNDVEIQPVALSGEFTKDNQNLIANFLNPVRVPKGSNPKLEAEFLREMVQEGLNENSKLIKTLSPSNMKKLGKEPIYL